MVLSRSLFLGFIKLHILYHAGQEPVFGLWLIEELARHGYRLSPGTLYPILHGLEKEGFLAREARVVDGKMRKYYALTADGRTALEEGRLKAVELLKEIENT
ncbi:MAG: PadR family transcriptional regulator [Chloroflexi bacterium]|nr:PadR family transcriptional regulator [Chloroflexota bacterium]